MKKIIFLLIVYPLFVTSNLHAQNLSKNEVFDVLSKWEGKWKNSVVFEESVWISKSFETRGITDSKLILSNNYLEMMTYNGDETSKYIIRYDQIQSSSIDGNLKATVEILFGQESGIRVKKQ